MKRTRQRYDRPGQEMPEFTSGCRQFEGEDLQCGHRLAIQAADQKQWCEEQKNELAAHKKNEADEEKAYADQTEAITRMRGMLEDESTNKRNAAYKQLQVDNARMAQEKRDRESNWKNGQANSNKNELDSTINKNVLQTTFAASTMGSANPRDTLPYNYQNYVAGK